MKTYVKIAFAATGILIAIGVIYEMNKTPEERAKEEAAKRAKDSTTQAQNAEQTRIREAQAAENERKSKLLGLSVNDALNKFSEIEGVEITTDKYKTGESRTMATYKSFMVECVGESDNIRLASIVVLNDGDRAYANLNAVALQRFVKNVLNSDDLNPFAAAIKAEKSTFQVNGLNIEAVNTVESGMKATKFTIQK